MLRGKGPGPSDEAVSNVEDQPEDRQDDRPEDRPHQDPFLRALETIEDEAVSVILRGSDFETQFKKVEEYYELADTRPQSPPLRIPGGEAPETSPRSASRGKARSIFASTPEATSTQDTQTSDINRSASPKR